MEDKFIWILNIGIVVTYSMIILSLVWARLKFFKTVSKASLKVAFVNEPLVAIQIIATFYLMITVQRQPLPLVLGMSGYIFSFSLFWWSVKTAKSLNFATEDSKSEIIKEGPFSIIRHPFYLSYIATWATSTFIHGGILLWGSLAGLTILYVVSAKKEESKFLEGSLSDEYAEYTAKVGMFFPKFFRTKV